MTKYHFYFENRSGEKIVEYDTDVEPPRIGDIVQFNELTNDKDENVYKVHELWYAPLSEERVRILFTLDVENHKE